MPSLSVDAGEIEATSPRGEVVLVSPFAEAPSDVLLALPPDPRAARQARRALAEARIPEELEHTVGLLVTDPIANPPAPRGPRGGSADHGRRPLRRRPRPRRGPRSRPGLRPGHGSQRSRLRPAHGRQARLPLGRRDRRGQPRLVRGRPPPPALRPRPRLAPAPTVQPCGEGASSPAAPAPC